MASDRTCQVGQASPCGKPALHVIAIREVSDSVWTDEQRRGGVVYLCEMHANSSPVEWGDW
jgi:hypothetical protein